MNEIVKQYKIHQNLTKFVRKIPDKIFIREDITNRKITYNEFYQCAKAMAKQLMSLPDRRPIAIMLNKSIEQIVAIVSIVLSGRAYLPLDCNWPQERINKIIRQSGINSIITSQDIIREKSKLAFERIFDINLASSFEVEFIEPNISVEDLAYILFTSGSTGTPKGVAIKHGGVYNSIEFMNSLYQLDDQACVLSLSASVFDLSVYDIFGMLDIGGSLVILPETHWREPRAWLDSLSSGEITVWNSVPAFAQMLVDYIEASEYSNLIFPEMKLIILGGDWIPLNLPERLKNVFLNAEIVSVGGSTETSIWGCYYPIKKVSFYWNSIPYGRAVRGQNMQVLNDLLEPASAGEIGEIYFGGIGLAEGYFGDSEATSKVFIKHPKTGERLYCSGDLGKLLEDGNIEFVARKDQQVQVNGYRVELAEIEKVLLDQPDVEKGVVLAIETSNHSKRIAAVVVGKNLDIENIKTSMSKFLPDYMIPQAIHFVDDLPLSTNGKVDRHKLIKNLMESKINSEIILSEKESFFVLKLKKIWQEVLEIKEISKDDDFFNLGGTSIAAVQLIAKINKAFNCELPISILASCRTITLLTEKLNNTKNDFHMVKLNHRKAHDEVLFIFHPVGGEVLCYDHMANQLNFQAYGISFPQKGLEYDSLDKLASYYADQIILFKNSKTYSLCGWSSGGTIAFAVTKELLKRGRKVEFLGIIDTTNPNFYRERLDNRSVNFNAVKYYLNEIGKYFDKHEGVFKKYNSIESIGDFSLIDLINKMNTELNFEKDLKNSILPEQVKRAADKFSHVLKLVANYIVTGCIDQIHFFRAEHSVKNIDIAWRAFSKNPIISYLIPGDHLSIMESPNVNFLADSLNSSLKNKINFE